MSGVERLVAAWCRLGDALWRFVEVLARLVEGWRAPYATLDEAVRAMAWGRSLPPVRGVWGPWPGPNP